MFDEVFACVDGSPLAEHILPVAALVASKLKAKLTVLRVVTGAAEVAALEGDMSECARRYRGQSRLVVAPAPADGIVAELERNSSAIAAMTTHGRTDLGKVLLGSVAREVIQRVRRPVIVYSPEESKATLSNIDNIAIALDGSPFSERILTVGIGMAKSMDAKPILLQVLPVEGATGKHIGAAGSDILESSYLHAKSAEVKKLFGIEPAWDVLHGDPADALSAYVSGMPNTLLAMTSHAHGGIKRLVLGSVAAECVRKAGVPLLLMWPEME